MNSNPNREKMSRSWQRNLYNDDCCIKCCELHNNRNKPNNSKEVTLRTHRIGR